MAAQNGDDNTRFENESRSGSKKESKSDHKKTVRGAELAGGEAACAPVTQSHATGTHHHGGGECGWAAW